MFYVKLSVYNCVMYTRNKECSIYLIQENIRKQLLGKFITRKVFFFISHLPTSMIDHIFELFCDVLNTIRVMKKLFVFLQVCTELSMRDSPLTVFFLN